MDRGLEGERLLRGGGDPSSGREYIGVEGVRGRGEFDQFVEGRCRAVPHLRVLLPNFRVSLSRKVVGRVLEGSSRRGLQKGLENLGGGHVEDIRGGGDDTCAVDRLDDGPERGGNSEGKEGPCFAPRVVQRGRGFYRAILLRWELERFSTLFARERGGGP